MHFWNQRRSWSSRALLRRWNHSKSSRCPKRKKSRSVLIWYPCFRQRKKNWLCSTISSRVWSKRSRAIWTSMVSESSMSSPCWPRVSWTGESQSPRSRQLDQKRELGPRSTTIRMKTRTSDQFLLPRRSERYWQGLIFQSRVPRTKCNSSMQPITNQTAQQTQMAVQTTWSTKRREHSHKQRRTLGIAEVWWYSRGLPLRSCKTVTVKTKK